MIQASSHLLNPDQILDEGYRIVLGMIKEKSRYANGITEILHSTCGYGERNTGFHWEVVVVNACDGFDYLDIVGYQGRLEKVDINKPLKNQITLETTEGAHFDLYIGEDGSKKTTVGKLRNLANRIEGSIKQAS